MSSTSSHGAVNTVDDAILVCSNGDMVDLSRWLDDEYRAVGVDDQDESGLTPLMAACGAHGKHRGTARGGVFNPLSVQYLLDRGADLNVADKTGMTALMWACSYGKHEFVREFLDRGANVNVKTTNDGSTPLMVASRSRWDPDGFCAQFLVDRGADVNARDKYGITPLIIEASGYTKRHRYLLDRGACVNASTDDGFTALMMACISGNIQNVRDLLDRGADVNAAAIYGVTALMKACRCLHGRCVNIMRDLLDHGACVNASTDDGFTALMMACSGYGSPERVRVLLERGADVNVSTDDGETCLMMACRWYGSRDCAKIVCDLLDHGADANASTDEGETCLMMACLEEHTDSVRALLERGADVHRATRSGDTALTLACKSSNSECAKILVRHGASWPLDERGIDALETSFLTAKERGNEDAVAYLVSVRREFEKKRLWPLDRRPVSDRMAFLVSQWDRGSRERVITTVLYVLYAKGLPRELCEKVLHGVVW